MHGLAFSTSKEDKAKMDEQEGVGRYYDKVDVTFDCYDGRKI